MDHIVIRDLGTTSKDLIVWGINVFPAQLELKCSKIPMYIIIARPKHTARPYWCWGHQPENKSIRIIKTHLKSTRHPKPQISYPFNQFNH